MLDEPDYGEVKARIRGWNADKPELGVYWQELNLRQCTKDELGLGNMEEAENYEASKFYPPHKNSFGFF